MTAITNKNNAGVIPASEIDEWTEPEVKRLPTPAEVELRLENAQLRDAIKRQRDFTQELADKLRKTEEELHLVMGSMARTIQDEMDIRRSKSATTLTETMSPMELAERLVDSWRESRGLKAELEAALEVHKYRMEERAIAERVTPVTPGELRPGLKLYAPLEVLFVYDDGRPNPYGMKFVSGFTVNLEAEELVGAFLVEGEQ